MSAEVPTVEKSRVYHVGDLNKERTTPAFSYEGGGLSVSEHPEAWQQIMASGGDTYELTADPTSFLLATDSGTDELIADWIPETEHVDQTAGWRVTWVDATGDTHRQLFYSHEKAEFEYSDRVAAGVECSMEECDVLELDSGGREYWASTFDSDPSYASPLQVEALLPVWFAEEQGFGGVWWDEELAPAQYSAPRGVIFQSELTNWDYRKVDYSREQATVRSNI